MGVSTSKTANDEKVFLNETPISFSPDVVDRLTDQSSSPITSSERQSTLDSHIRSRIQVELEKLRSEEEDVRQEIELALEKENLDRERSMAGEEDASALGGVKSSTALLGDLKEIRTKVDRFHARKDLSNFPIVKESQETLLACYRSHPTTTLDCWREVNKFRAAVTQVEQEYFKSLP